MREGMGQPGQRLVPATKTVYEELGRDEQKVCVVATMRLPFFKIYKIYKRGL